MKEYDKTRRGRRPLQGLQWVEPGWVELLQDVIAIEIHIIANIRDKIFLIINLLIFNLTFSECQRWDNYTI